MRRLALLPLLLAACTADTVEGVPSIAVGADADNVTVDFLQQPDHSFDARLTINGVEAPAPQVSPGHVPPANTSPFADQPSPSSATFTIPRSMLSGNGVHVVLDDGGDHYVVDLPQLLAKRTLHAAIPATVHAGDTIALDTGVPGDEIQSYAQITQDCLDVYGDSALVMPTLTDAWRCGTPPTTGTTMATTFSFEASLSAQITTCDGPGLTCVPTQLGQLTLDAPATLAF